MQNLEGIRALLVVVLDAVDLSGTMPERLWELSEGRIVVLVVNKIDLIIGTKLVGPVPDGSPILMLIG